MEIFKYILILLSCSVIFVVICRRFHLPAIIGYLSVGMVVGPGGFGWLPTIEDMNHLAEFGIVFLMFTLGLEFSIPRLIATKRILLGLGGLQVITCTAVGSCAAWLLGFNAVQSLIVGGGLALSSTAVVVKQLTEQKRQHTAYGSMAINILLFQDLAAVGFLILIPAVSGSESNPIHITFLLTIIKGFFAFVSMTLLSMWVLRPLFHEVAKARSTELFMMATLLVALSAAGVTYYLGLSMALGAFLAGLMLGETEFRHQIELDIRPFRDVLLGLFFVVIGANLDLSLLPTIIDKVLLLLVALIFGKMVLIAGIVKSFSKLSIQASLRTGLILAHGGEFTFVILTEAIDNDILSDGKRPILFSAVVLSLMCAPLLIRYSDQIINLFSKRSKDDIDLKEFSHNQLSEHAAELENHVILCGYGRVGQILGRFLDQENIPWIALDTDPIRLSKSSMAGEHAFFGDSTYPNTLLSAGLSRARMVVITFSSEAPSLQVVKHVREMRLDVPLFVRTQDDSNLKAFQDAGATEVVPETLESSLMLASHLLLTLGVPTKKIVDKIRTIHADRYEILRGMYRGEDDFMKIEDEQESRRSLHSIFVPEGATSIDQPLASIASDDKEFYIKSLTRDSERILDPELETPIQVGDVIVIFATPEETAAIEEQILNGRYEVA
jgi:CPA2 family monovalent cation:H+ antiporter-2